MNDGPPRRRPPARRANALDGKTWTRNSLSLWSDIRKSEEELRLKHPAMFPAQLVERVIQCFLRPDDRVVLDPFSGVGSTPVTAARLGKTGIGIERNPDYLALARTRCAVPALPPDGSCALHEGDARDLGRWLGPESVDLVFTSPPYWNILTQRRTADYGEIRNYGDDPADLGTIADYDAFIAALGEVFQAVWGVLKPDRYCVVNVMDLRRKARFYPLHMDLAREMARHGFALDDLIVWDRRHEYNRLRPLGYPAVFRVNKVHEFLLIFHKPATPLGRR
jgi:DNA modification methylase